MSNDYSVHGNPLTVGDVNESIQKGELVLSEYKSSGCEQAINVRVATSDQHGHWVWLYVNENNEISYVTTYSGNSEEEFDMWLQERDSFLVFES
jgi:hypothetical protein